MSETVSNAHILYTALSTTPGETAALEVGSLPEMVVFSNSALQGERGHH